MRSQERRCVVDKQRIVKIVVAVVVIFIVGLSVTVYLKHQIPAARELRFALGTLCEIEIVGIEKARAAALINEGFAIIKQFEGQLSIYDPESEVSRANKFASMLPVPISRTTYDVIKASLGYARESNGLFDITVLPLVAVWGFSSKEFARPSQEAIDNALVRVDWKKVMLTKAGDSFSIEFRAADMQIDLGGIAKGYICEKVSDAFLEAGLKDFLVNIGGNIYAHGRSRKKHYWVAGVRDPREKSAVIEKVELVNEAIATSGDYERFFIENGKRYSHILDPRTGYPVQGTVAVTVIAPSALQTDAASTIIFLTPRDQRQAMVEKLGLKRAFVFEEDPAGKMLRSDYFSSAS
jgi:thiamine biosynthesis lipoprotein ApbE